MEGVNMYGGRTLWDLVEEPPWRKRLKEEVMKEPGLRVPFVPKKKPEIRPCVLRGECHPRVEFAEVPPCEVRVEYCRLEQPGVYRG
jgi:hypothetical protein